MSEQYQTHKLIRGDVFYENNVAATTPGALAVYFRSDVGVPMQAIGREAIAHAATHDSYSQTSVWEPTHLHIKPSDALKQYFDEETGDWRFTVQGFIIVMAASSLQDGLDYGNLYFEYEYEFTDPEVDLEVSDVNIITGNWCGSTTAPTLDNLVVFEATTVGPVATASAPRIQIPADWTGSIGASYVLEMTITGIDTAQNSVWRTEGNPAQQFDLGQTFFLRGLFRETDAKVIYTCYSNLADAVTGTTRGNPDEIPPGALYYSTTAADGATSTNGFTARVWSVADFSA
jgi:hypothetical protein